MNVVEVLPRVQLLLKGITRNKYFHTANFRAGKSWLWGLTISIKDILGLISTLWPTFARFWFLENTCIGYWIAEVFVYN